MTLKTGHKILLFGLALVALLLVVGIQSSLAVAAENQGRAEAERISRAVFAKAQEVAVMQEQLEAEEGRQAAAQSVQLLQDKLEAISDGDILMLVNPWHPMPEDYVPTLQLLNTNDGHSLDERCADAFWQMYVDCGEAGNLPLIISSYRNYWMQYELYERKILRLMYDEGVSAEEAPAVAALSVAVPNTSEHQVGLAVDIIDMLYTNLDEGQENTSTQKWLMENSWRYGFILRYPNGTTDITGIIYEPWHYRYVGLDAAKKIYDMDLTLEEYLIYLGFREPHQAAVNS